MLKTPDATCSKEAVISHLEDITQVARGIQASFEDDWRSMVLAARQVIALHKEIEECKRMAAAVQEVELVMQDIVDGQAVAPSDE